jgi:hypothetical protein
MPVGTRVRPYSVDVIGYYYCTDPETSSDVFKSVRPELAGAVEKAAGVSSGEALSMKVPKLFYKRVCSAGNIEHTLSWRRI